MTMASRLVCQGCGQVVDLSNGLEFVCPRAGDGRDHVLLRELDEASLPFSLEGDTAFPDRPFLRWRHRFHAYHLGLSRGLTDQAIISKIENLDEAIARIDRRFTVTPLFRADDIASILSREAPIYIKDETGHVAGSHKARHLFPVLLALELMEVERLRPLAIASCGNAALAAAVLARAAERPLMVFIPPEADPVVVTRLVELGARVSVCERAGDTGGGDPTVSAFSRAVADGAIPFSCQGHLNGLALEGGETLGWEIADQLAQLSGRSGGEGDGGQLDRVFVQVGGGLLAAALSRGLEQAFRAGRLGHLPRLHPVQTSAVAPLARAYDKLLGRLIPNCEVPTRDRGREFAQASERRAIRFSRELDPLALAAIIEAAARTRQDYMWPWEPAGHSAAHGLLDDETYDWLAVMRAMLRSGGHPLVVDEAEVVGANTLATGTTAIPVDETGSVSLAGLLQLALCRVLPARESCLVLFTGRRRVS